MRVPLATAVLVLGACDRGPAIFSDTRIFEPSADTWSRGLDLPGGITGHSATLLSDGTILVAGGASLDLSKDLVHCNLVTQICKGIGTLGEQHERHDAVLLPDGRVLVGGGDTPGAPEVVDPTAVSAEPMADSGTDGARLVGLNDGRVLALGDETQIFDASLDMWIDGGAPIESRGAPALTLLDDGKAIATGGYCGDCDPTSTEVYDLTTATWSPGPSLLTGHEGHTATLLDDGSVLVVGGASPSGQVFAEILDPVNAVSIPTCDERCNLVGHRATRLNDGRVLITGGHQLGGGEQHPTYSIFNPVLDEWTHFTTGLSWRMDHDATLLPDGRVLVTGGDIGYLDGRAAD